MPSLTEVLQSEPVKRLLHRPNVILQSMGPAGSFVYDINSNNSENSNGTIEITKKTTKSQVSLIPITNEVNDVYEEDDLEDQHLLPSKTNGKSDVALLPIKREQRPCGHSEPCENIVCDVAFQQFADESSVSPVIATNIDESEINAPVAKHCTSSGCDALSIDHDRCRRAIVRCHKIDETNTCDMCMIVFKTRKSRMNHKNCKMRIEYRHNRASCTQIMKDRMRLRELQILEAVRSNKNDYSDPITGYDKAVESLRKNAELVVIEKNPIAVVPRQMIKITSVSGATIPTNPQDGETFNKILPGFPIVFPPRNIVLTNSTSSNETIESLSSNNQGNKSIALESLQFNSDTAESQVNKYITIRGLPTGNFAQPVNITNLFQAQRTQGGEKTTGKPFLVPVRVVPITGLKSAPSLIDRTQGIPKFCIVADNGNQSKTIGKSQAKENSRQDLSKVSERNDGTEKQSSTNIGSIVDIVPKKLKSSLRRYRRKKSALRRLMKPFECHFCLKKFSTDWYFKLHIAKHKGEIKHICKFCNKPFMHIYNLTKHIVIMHKMNKDMIDETVNDEDIKNAEKKLTLSCGSCKIFFESKNEMYKHTCRILCLVCRTRVTSGNFVIHLKKKHGMTDDKAIEEFHRQKKMKGTLGTNREIIKKDRNVDCSTDEISGNCSEKFIGQNGFSKRKKIIGLMSTENREENREINDNKQCRSIEKHNVNSSDDCEDLYAKKIKIESLDITENNLTIEANGLSV